MVGFDPIAEAELRSLEIPVVLDGPTPTQAWRHDLSSGRSRLTSALVSAGSVAALSFPIIYDEDRYGWMTVDVTHHPERLDDNNDITERLRGLAGQAAIAIRNSRLLEEIRHQALHDHLTGLPNRVLVVDRMEQTLARARREHLDVALLFVDLDGFKGINDNFGHAVGDQVLKAVAARFSGTLRESDTVARLGGDEFVVLAEGLSLAAGPELVAERLLAVLAEPFPLGADSDASVSVTASIGIAAGRRDTADELLRDADIALYAAKDAGRNRYVVFEAEMQTVLRSRHELEMDLQVAIGADQFFLLYQPIFNLTDMSVVGGGSTPALASSRPGLAPARRVHPDARGIGPHHSGRALGAPRSVPAGHGLAPGRAADPHVGQRLRSTARCRRAAQRRASRLGHVGPPAGRPGH